MKYSINAQWHKSIKEISENQWNNLIDHNSLPFYKWNWLFALEQSESVSPKYGWQPIHLSLWENDRIIALAPLYLKNHSYGEFIFDHEFAKLSVQLGLEYYPKLIGMSPLSPIEGYRFFIAKDKDEEELTTIILKIIDDFAIKNKLLSCNFLYVNPNWKNYLESVGYLTWTNRQTQWNSIGEITFEDYLKRFNSNQRRNIKRERNSIKKANLEIKVLNNDDIDLEMLRLMHKFYENHCAKWGVWGSKYLSNEFFERLEANSLKKNIVLFNAHRGDPKNPVAMSLCIKNREMLWGRYWGSKEIIQNLHFELCYYSPINWAINNGIKKFDPGAGGKHKIRRGFQAIPCFSMHRWYNKNMEVILKSCLPKLNNLIVEEINNSNNEAPFRIL